MTDGKKVFVSDFALGVVIFERNICRCISTGRTTYYLEQDVHIAKLNERFLDKGGGGTFHRNLTKNPSDCHRGQNENSTGRHC